MAPKLGKPGSARALAPEHDLDGLQQDGKVEQETAVLHVIEVVLQFLERVLLGGTVRITQLCPTSDAGLHRVSLAIIGNLLLERVDEFRTLGARPDETHVSAQDVPQLG